MPEQDRSSADPFQASGPAEELPKLRLKRLGIDTHDELIIYMRADCEVCRSEGFGALARVRVSSGEDTLIATLNIVTSRILDHDEASLSERAWSMLDAQEGELVRVTHPSPLASLGHVRAKVYGNTLDGAAYRAIIEDIVANRYSSAQISSFITACAGGRMTLDEMAHLTRAMIATGKQLTWDQEMVVDKHSVGGLPGNRTTPIVVPIVAVSGLTMPKTSSRAITSPAGTADTMATLTDVDLTLEQMRRVVHEQAGCMVWGGSVRLAPADDILIRVERALNLDSEGQMIASILSKKAAAGSTHVVIDMPVGATAKVRDQAAADELTADLEAVGGRIGLHVSVVATDGSQPVGRGVGPALEARDVLAVLKGKPEAPQDLRQRSLLLAGRLLELADTVPPGQGQARATEILDSGQAWERFQAICQAQGGLREPPVARHTHPIVADRAGQVEAFDNRRLARVAKLAGAPEDPGAGLVLHARLGDRVEADQPLFTIHAESPGELAYALEFVSGQDPVVQVGQG